MQRPGPWPLPTPHGAATDLDYAPATDAPPSIAAAWPTAHPWASTHPQRGAAPHPCCPQSVPLPSACCRHSLRGPPATAARSHVPPRLIRTSRAIAASLTEHSWPPPLPAGYRHQRPRRRSRLTAAHRPQPPPSATYTPNRCQAAPSDRPHQQPPSPAATAAYPVCSSRPLRDLRANVVPPSLENGPHQKQAVAAAAATVATTTVTAANSPMPSFKTVLQPTPCTVKSHPPVAAPAAALSPPPLTPPQPTPILHGDRFTPKPDPKPHTTTSCSHLIPNSSSPRGQVHHTSPRPSYRAARWLSPARRPPQHADAAADVATATCPATPPIAPRWCRVGTSSDAPHSHCRSAHRRACAPYSPTGSVGQAAPAASMRRGVCGISSCGARTAHPCRARG